MTSYNERKSRIEAEAEKIFGNAEKAKMWLQQRNLALGAAPISLLNTREGEAKVQRILASICYGGVV